MFHYLWRIPLGVPVEIKAITQLLPAKEGGASMLELRDTLGQIGLDAVGKRLTVGELVLKQANTGG